MSRNDTAHVCAECGRPSCDAKRDELLARDYEQPVLYWQFHRMAVDAYCLQHSSYVASAKSLVAHLCGLCLAFEHDNDAEKLRNLQRWLSTNPEITKPQLPIERGQMTIGDVCHIADPTQFGSAVNLWARATWDAYTHLHSIAREWVSIVCDIR